MKRLGVNIDHVATIRNARGEFHPDPLYAAKIVKKYGHLPYCKSKTEDGKIPYRCFEVEGEVAFTNVYLKEGYKIALFNQEKYGPQPCPDVSGEYS